MLSSAVDTLVRGAAAVIAESYHNRIGALGITIISPTFDARSEAEKAEDERQKEISHRSAIGELMRRYDREKLYREI